MPSYLYARFPEGRIVRADSLDPKARRDYLGLSCIGCGARMIPALGTVLRWHFRHEEGEGCAEYFAALAEGLILSSLRKAQGEGQPYWLKVRNLAPIDLSRSRDILQGTELEGRRVDIALVTDRNRINIVIARRKEDLRIAPGAPGLWLTIDVTGEDEDFIGLLEHGITVDADGRLRTENFPDQLRQAAEAQRRAEEARRRAAEVLAERKAHHERNRSFREAVFRTGKTGARRDDDLDDLIETEDAHVRAPAGEIVLPRAPVEDPDLRLPGETNAEHRARLIRKYPWMRRRP